MKKSKYKYIVAGMLALAVVQPTAYASNPEPEERVQKEEKPKADKKRLFKSGGIGCGIGAVTGYLFNRDKKSALAGCVVGGGAGVYASYREQMEEARELEQAAKDAGMRTEVKTKPVTENGEQQQAFDGIVIRYNASDMAKLDERTSAMLDRLSSLAKRSKNELSFTFSGRQNCEVPIAELHKREALANHKVINQCGLGESAITVTPLPEL